MCQLVWSQKKKKTNLLRLSLLFLASPFLLHPLCGFSSLLFCFFVSLVMGCGRTEPAFPLSDAWGPATGQIQQEGVPEQRQRLSCWRPPSQTGQLFTSLRYHKQDWTGQPSEEPPPALAQKYVLWRKYIPTSKQAKKNLQEHSPAASPDRLNRILLRFNQHSKHISRQPCTKYKQMHNTVMQSQCCTCIYSKTVLHSILIENREYIKIEAGRSRQAGNCLGY